MSGEPSKYAKRASSHPWRIGLIGGTAAFVCGLLITRSVAWSTIGGMFTYLLCWSMWREGSIVFRFRLQLRQRFPRAFR